MMYKMSREDVKEYIGYTHNKPSRMYNWYIDFQSDGCYIKCKIKMIPYLLLFIPAHIIDFSNCIWDGGLITFHIIKRVVREDYISIGTDTYKELYSKYNK